MWYLAKLLERRIHCFRWQLARANQRVHQLSGHGRFKMGSQRDRKSARGEDRIIRPWAREPTREGGRVAAAHTPLLGCVAGSGDQTPS